MNQQDTQLKQSTHPNPTVLHCFGRSSLVFRRNWTIPTAIERAARSLRVTFHKHAPNRLTGYVIHVWRRSSAGALPVDVTEIPAVNSSIAMGQLVQPEQQPFEMANEHPYLPQILNYHQRNIHSPHRNCHKSPRCSKNWYKNTNKIKVCGRYWTDTNIK